MKTAFQQWVDYLFPDQKEENETYIVENPDYLRGFNDALKLIKGEKE